MTKFLDAWDLTAAAGGLTIVVGVGLWNVPAAVVLAGGTLVIIGLTGAKWVSSRQS